MSILGKAREALARLFGESGYRLEVLPTACGGCHATPLVHKNGDGSVEVRCVDPACPDPRWTTLAGADEAEAVAQWNLLNRRPLWTVEEAKRGVAETGSRHRFRSQRGVFGEKDN